MQQEGIVEHVHGGGYGFIRPRSKKRSVFFHMSAVNGGSAREGDEVRFTEGVDPRTGKPAALSVVRLVPGSIQQTTVGERTHTGLVVDGPRGPHPGRIAVDGPRPNTVSFTAESLADPSCELVCDDRVSFKLMSDFFGAQTAVEVALDTPELTRGVVRTLKDSFGFIERLDTDELTFFHFGDWQCSPHPAVGDCVEFRLIQRRSKTAAAGIRLLPPGSVVIEEVSEARERGTVASLPSSSRHRAGVPGTIALADGTAAIFEADSMLAGPAEPPGIAVSSGALRVNDVVSFLLAHNRRTGSRSAVDVVLEQPVFDGQARARGTIATVKASEGFGFLSAGGQRLFFHMSEILTPGWNPRGGDDVEYELADGPKPRAVRLRRLPRVAAPGAGTIARMPAAQGGELGEIQLADGSIAVFRAGDVHSIRRRLQVGDRVACTVVQGAQGAHAERIALERAGGHVSQLHDSFGFIETAALDSEVYFSAAECSDFAALQLGAAVTYAVSNETHKGRAARAVDVRRVDADADVIVLDEGVVTGKVTKALRGTGGYAGLIACTQPSGEFPFGIGSLVDPRQPPSVGARVEFRIANDLDGEGQRAMRVKVVQTTAYTARISAVYPDHGILAFTPPSSKVVGVRFPLDPATASRLLVPGTEVSFTLGYNAATDEYSAENVAPMRRATVASLSKPPQPIRQPLGPDGTRGFQRRASTSSVFM
eukprot:m.247739 g.247739  ORF g.247739 m.247739 type:complete len:709 (-) comp15483_c0_seq1:77-2203(-)